MWDFSRRAALGRQSSSPSAVIVVTRASREPRADANCGPQHSALQQIANLAEHAMGPAIAGSARAPSLPLSMTPVVTPNEMAPPRRAMMISTAGSSPTTPRWRTGYAEFGPRNARRAARACQ